MAHERWKRTDEAVANSWLRGLRSSGGGQAVSSAQRMLKSGPRAKAPLRSLDRSVAAAER